METSPLETRKLNRKSRLPLHEQLYEIFKGLIAQGGWKVGDMIPGELELGRTYGVSRIVVRQVLNRLVNEGLIYRQQGRGTFVASLSLEQGLTRIISFTEDMRTRGLAPSTLVLFTGLVPAPDDIAARLRVPPGEELARLERLRLANGEPMSIEESYLVHRQCPGLLGYDFAQVPLRETLEKVFGLRIVQALQTIRAVAALPTQAKILRIPNHAPLLLVERVSFTQQDAPVEFLRIHYRGDRYSLYNELRD